MLSSEKTQRNKTNETNERTSDMTTVETFIDYLSNLELWQVRTIQAVLLLISLPGVALAYYVWIHHYVEDAIEMFKDWRRGWDPVEPSEPVDLSTPEMVRRINQATLDSHRTYRPYESYASGEYQRVIAASNLRERHGLYVGNGHDLGFLLLGYTRVGYTRPANRLFPSTGLKGYHLQESKTQKRKDNMKTVLIALVIALGIAMFATCPAQGETSFTASGDVYSINSTNGLKIQKADGSKVAALRGNNPLVWLEYDNASPGEYAFGRATCNGGVCVWSCLEVVDECTTGGKYFALSGVVTGKDSCAGVLFVTVLINTGGEMRAPCLGEVAAMCQGVDIGESVYTEFDLTCGDTYWRAMVGK